MVKRKERICKRLRLNPLRSVNYEYRPLTGGKGSGDFVVEVNVSRSVDKIENICFAVLCLVFEFDGACFYRYSAFAFKVHIVEKLVFHFTGRYGLRHFENTVGKRGFAVVDMRDYAKISYIRGVL